MHNITLIGTMHSEIGKCNADELHKIMEDINPGVIFEELPGHLSDMCYSDSFDMYCANSILLNRHFPVVPLEIKCIKKYSQNHNIKIIPVDIDDNDVIEMTLKYKELENNTFLKCEDYKKYDYEIKALISQGGFHYLNSKEHLDNLEEMEVMQKNILEFDIVKDRKFNEIRLFRSKVIDNRENAMLQNIYNYSKGNQYNQAVFLIGAGHRKSIIEKIEDFKKQEDFKLNWTFYAS